MATHPQATPLQKGARTVAGVSRRIEPRHENGVPPRCEKTLRLGDWNTVNAIFAGDIAGNLPRVEKALDIKLVSRDSWIKIFTEDSAKLNRTEAFLMDMRGRVGGGKITKHDFTQTLSAYGSGRENELREFFARRVKVSPRKNDVVPRTAAQAAYLESIDRREIVFGIGPAGTGKTYLAMAMAVSSLLEGRHGRIVLTRPAREAGENLGFLPGNLEEKIMPYLRPLYDALYDMIEFEEVASLIEKNIIEVAPLAFMRGRTLNSSFVILDEAQNTSIDQMLMFLTRIGFDSRCVITGDPSQTDLATGGDSGLLHAGKILRNIPEIAFQHFTTKDIVRNGLIEKIVNAYSADMKDRRHV